MAPRFDRYFGLMTAVAIYFAATFPALALYDTTSFTTSYSAYDPSGSKSWSLPMKIYTPTKAGTYAIAIVLGGAGTCEDPPVCSSGYGVYASTVAADAAKRGLIAAAVHYDSRIAHFCGCTGGENWTRGVAPTGDPLNCEPPHDGWDDKTRAVFDQADANSALRRIVAVTAARGAKASLAKGIVVMGHSQGSWMAHMAEAYTTRGEGGRSVAGALLTGTGVWGYHGRVDPFPYPVPCNAHDAPGVVPGGRLRVLDGSRDEILGVNTNAIGQPPSPSGYPPRGSALGARRSGHAVTGLCGAVHTTQDWCLPTGADGGGWRVVLPSHLTEGYGGADHAFMTDTKSSAKGRIDPKWRYGWPGEPLSPAVSLKQNLNWLARRLGPAANVLQLP
jgi:hypothetical protein